MNILDYRVRRFKPGVQVTFNVTIERTETRNIPVVANGYDPNTDELIVRAALDGERADAELVYTESVFETLELTGVVMTVERRTRTLFIVSSGLVYVVAFNDVLEVYPG